MVLMEPQLPADLTFKIIVQCTDGVVTGTRLHLFGSLMVNTTVLEAEAWQSLQPFPPAQARRN